MKHKQFFDNRELTKKAFKTKEKREYYVDMGNYGIIRYSDISRKAFFPNWLELNKDREMRIRKSVKDYKLFNKKKVIGLLGELCVLRYFGNNGVPFLFGRDYDELYDVMTNNYFFEVKTSTGNSLTINNNQRKNKIRTAKNFKKKLIYLGVFFESITPQNFRCLLIRNINQFIKPGNKYSFVKLDSLNYKLKKMVEIPYFRYD